jgi:hypothetical protein
MAEFERSLIQESVKAGLRNARAKGKKFGRPRVEIDTVQVAELRRNRLSWSQVCRTLNVSKGSAQRSVAHGCIRAPTVLGTEVQHPTVSPEPFDDMPTFRPSGLAANKMSLRAPRGAAVKLGITRSVPTNPEA